MNHRLELFTACSRRLTFVCGFAVMAAIPHHTLKAAEPAHLRVNQVGYLPDESKVALALTNADLTGQTFTVVKAGDNSAAFTGAVGDDRGDYGNFAHVYELDFSGLDKEGAYRVRLGSDSSSAFSIQAKVYTGVLPPSLQFFRVQRCGNSKPLLHESNRARFAACHLTDGVVANGSLQGAKVAVQGGWHDAGDYLKFVTTCSFATTLMLHSYQRHPGAFADADNNKLPDVLDEARVGLDWLLKMWDATHQVLYYQVGDYHDHYEMRASPDWRMPERDDLDRPTRPVWACEEGKGANVAGEAASALALASVLWNDPTRPFYAPKLASTYLTAAQQIYKYGKERPAVQQSTSDPNMTPAFVFYEDDEWKDEMALAAVELYRATRNETYLTEARQYARQLGSTERFEWAEVGALAQYEIARLDPSYVSTATDFLQEDLTIYQTRSHANRFRAAEMEFDWGSGETMVGAALTALWYEDLSGDTQFHGLAQAQRDYMLGNNPWGVCFVNSVGTAWPHHPHHQIAKLTGSELVGFWDEGPASPGKFENHDIRLRLTDPYAAFQTETAVYHDDWEDYITNEPTLSMNAVGLALTAWYAAGKK